MKITDSILKVDGVTANCYVIMHDNKVVLVDAGMKSYFRKISRFLDENNIKPDVVLVTHYHPDHIGGLKDLKDTYGMEIYADQREIGVISGAARVTPAKSMMSRVVAATFKTRPVDGVKPTSEIPFDWIRPIETVGHTPGSTSYLFVPENALFVGDAVTTKGGRLAVNSQFTLDLGKAEISKEKIEGMKGSLILPGHGDQVRIQ